MFTNTPLFERILVEWANGATIRCETFLEGLTLEYRSFEGQKLAEGYITTSGYVDGEWVVFWW